MSIIKELTKYLPNELAYTINDFLMPSRNIAKKIMKRKVLKELLETQWDCFHCGEIHSGGLLSLCCYPNPTLCDTCLQAGHRKYYDDYFVRSRYVTDEQCITSWLDHILDR